MTRHRPHIPTAKNCRIAGEEAKAVKIIGECMRMAKDGGNYIIVKSSLDKMTHSILLSQDFKVEERDDGKTVVGWGTSK